MMRLLRRRNLFKVMMVISTIPITSYLMMGRPDGRDVKQFVLSDQSYLNTSKTANVLSTDDLRTRTYSFEHLRNSSTISGKSDNTLHWVQLSEYCNSPFTETTGDEGRIPDGFKLKSVHVFIQHGDRTSIHRSPWHGPEVFNCKFNSWYNGTNTKFKHFPAYMDSMAGQQGRRNHFLNWALYPDRNNCANSILTSRGALQHLQLGQHFFESYNKRGNLFDRKLSLTSQISVKSTSISRTYQSAVAFMYSFLPSFNISQIEHSPDLHFCTKRYTVQNSCYCKHANQLLILSEQMQKKLDRNLKHDHNYIENVTTLFEMARVPPIMVLAEAFLPFFCHNITFGTCSNSGPSQSCRDLIGDIWNKTIAGERVKFNDPDVNYLKYSSIVMTPVLVEILMRIKNIVENRPAPKFVLYSGNEAALSPLLYVLGIHDEKWPPYASRVVIELLESHDGPPLNNFYLKFLYNGVDKTNQVICCQDLTYKGLCNLNHITKFVFMKLLRRFGFNSYYDACSR